MPTGHDDEGRNVEPFALEGPGVGLHRDHGVVVQLGQYHLVLGVRKVFYHVLHFLADDFDAVVGLIAEENVDEPGKSLQFVVVGILCNVVVDDGLQPGGVGGVVGVVDDDLLAEDVALQPQSQQLHEEVAVGIHVEHHRVFVGLVGEEDGQRA